MIGEKLIRIFEENGIPYQLEGKNVKRGNMTIHCPFCGADDRGMHLGINLDDGAFSCWRDHTHRGRNTSRLIAILLDISIARARTLLGFEIFDQEEYNKTLQSLMNGGSLIPIKKLGGVDHLSLPPFFRTIDNSGLRKRFYHYLENRGLKNINYLIKRYDLRSCFVDEFTNRIIIPVYINNELMTWTSRSIDKEAKLKYRDLSIDESVRHCKFCLLDYDNIKEGGEVLYIVEGPFDAFNLRDKLPEGFEVTCLFTKQMTDEQSLLLYPILDLYSSVTILLDRDAVSQAISMLNKQFSGWPNVGVRYLPEGIKDPGELTKEQVERLLKSF